MPTPPRILAFSGSARRESLNRKLLAAVVARARSEGGDVTVVDLRELALPMYDGDLEDAEGMPPGAQRFVELITRHHALLIATPEYNSQMPALLKNAIDWATRADENPLKGKVAAVISASPGNFGAIRSMTLARALLIHLGCHVIPAQCVLPLADQGFDENGRLKEERAQKAADAVAKQLVTVAGKLG